MITPAQCRAARALLDWKQIELANHSDVGITAIRTFERGKTSPHKITLKALKETFETAGVEFIDKNGGGPGLRLKE